MVNNAETTARNAEKDTTNDPGMCLQQTRIWAGINSLYPDATTAWHNANRKQYGKNPPRGAAVYWTGGSKGYGHIAMSLGGGKVRSTDAGGRGRVATVSIDWVQRNWGLPYAGWADNINEVTIPGVGDEEDEMELNDKITNWSPDQGSTGELTIGMTLNQARGYSEDGYDRIKRLQNDVDDLTKTINAIAKRVGV